MAKELMEIGGFITEGAEIVNHDNSLSGNGTVDSPLGLNETVLWSGTGTSGTTLNLSESVKNFNTVKFYGHDSTRNKSMIYEQATNYLTGGETLSFTMQGWDNSIDAHWVGFYYSQLNYTNTAYSALTNSGGNQLYVNTETVGWFKNAGRYIILDKVVGINRKAQ